MFRLPPSGQKTIVYTGSSKSSRNEHIWHMAGGVVKRVLELIGSLCRDIHSKLKARNCFFRAHLQDILWEVKMVKTEVYYF